jgi:hypothetical protein
LDNPGQTVLVKWKDLKDGESLEIWHLASRKDLTEAKCDNLQEALGAVSGNITQTLHILLEYPQVIGLVP